jgi:endonuclease YncB( thermonuclease family)
MRVRVVWVVDGETIHVQTGRHRERVRDIGAHAPEIPHAVRGWRLRVRPRPSRSDSAVSEGLGPSGGVSELAPA